MMRIYIANAMRSRPLYNWPWFKSTAKALRAKGHDVVCPTEIDEEEGVVFVEYDADGTISDVRLTDLYDFGDIIDRDLAAVGTCDAILLGPDWFNSDGAVMELDEAEACDLDVFFDVGDVPDVSKLRRLMTEPTVFDNVDGMYPILDSVDMLRHQQRGDGEVRVVDPDTGGAKGSKLARFDLLPPDAMWAVAEHFGRGAIKYDARNWERGYAWGLSYAALQRHLTEFWAGEDIDEETGGYHMAAAAVHCLFLLAFQMRGAGTDDRTKTMGEAA